MIGNSWDNLLKDEYEKDYFINLKKFIINEYKTKTIYPKMSEIFNAFTKTTYDNVKVVIIGQDPYHGENEAEGLSFSVKKGIKKRRLIRSRVQAPQTAALNIFIIIFRWSSVRFLNISPASDTSRSRFFPVSGNGIVFASSCFS